MNPEEYRVMADLEGVQWWYVGMRRIARALLTPLLPAPGAGRRILDAGCGTGWNLQELSVFGDTYGVDLSPLAVITTRRRGGRVAQGNLLGLPYASSSFDVVTSFDVLYHAWVVDDAQAVRELARVLKPGGLMLVKVPALRILWGAHDEAVHSRHRYTRGELERLLESTGLKLVRSTYANSLLFPVLLTRRFLDRALNRHGSDVSLLPPLLEKLFGGLLSVEASLLGAMNLPIGASVFAVARKAHA
ncbi:MAG: methyltransferase domain-containing protein [Vicinamibacteria bacterium]|nr:methyltransferase domain-containing protein [Vicinamibacteria bacterium]